jgi:hypothetical protein
VLKFKRKFRRLKVKNKKKVTVNNVKQAKLLINVGNVIASALRFKLLTVAVEK